MFSELYLQFSHFPRLCINFAMFALEVDRGDNSLRWYLAYLEQVISYSMKMKILWLWDF